MKSSKSDFRLGFFVHCVNLSKTANSIVYIPSVNYFQDAILIEDLGKRYK
jgi:hypothetical protein